MKKYYYIQLFKYASELGDIVMFVDFSINAFRTPAIRERELQKWMDGVPSMVRDRSIYKDGLSEKEIEDFAKQSEKRIEHAYRMKFNSFELLSVNLGLVMMCTIMEGFFEHVLRIVFDANPKTLLTLSEEKNLTLKRLLDFHTYEEVLDDFKKKYLEHFSRQGIKIMLEEFNKIGIKSNEVFAWKMTSPEAKRRLSAFDSGTLIDIFDMRHSIVHNNVYPVKSVEEMLSIKDFFTQIIANLAHETMVVFYKYGILLDTHEQMRQAIKAEGGDPESYPPKSWRPK